MIPHLSPIAVQVRAIGERYVLLHLKCADGSITEDENAELTMLCAEKERDYAEEYETPREAGCSNKAPASI